MLILYYSMYGHIEIMAQAAKWSVLENDSWLNHAFVSSARVSRLFKDCNFRAGLPFIRLTACLTLV
jgi:hypothetical protein